MPGPDPSWTPKSCLTERVQQQSPHGSIHPSDYTDMWDIGGGLFQAEITLDMSTFGAVVKQAGASTFVYLVSPSIAYDVICLMLEQTVWH